MNTKENGKLKEFSLYERCILKIHKRLFKKFYHYVRIEIVNSVLK